MLGGMRWWVLLAGCSATAHIDLAFDVQLASQCQASVAPNNPPVPMSCNQLTLDCADHLLFRVRQDQDDKPGDIISSRCIDLAAVGHPRDLCALGNLKDPVSLIDSVPYGTTYIFQLAALRLQDPNGGCDNELKPPLRVFSGYSDPVLVDGKSHTMMVHLQSCGSCSDLPFMNGQDGAAASDMAILGASDLGSPLPDQAAPTDMVTMQVGDASPPSDGAAIVDAAPPDLTRLPDLSQPTDLVTPICPPGQMPSPYFSQGGAFCCPYPAPSTCKKPGDHCDTGGVALLPPGGCCAVCD
jgi:hypothetical protein